MFQALTNHIEENVPREKQKVYSKSLFGIDDIRELEEWLNNNYINLLNTDSFDGLLIILWKILPQKIKNNTFTKYTPNNTLFYIAKEWIMGKAYFEIFDNLKSNNIKVANRKLTIEHIIDICEQGLSYEASMILSSLIELLDLQPESKEREELKDDLKFIQKQLKYGLNSSNKIIIYELGFVDRVIAQELEIKLCPNQDLGRNIIQRTFQTKRNKIDSILNNYPSYFFKLIK